MNVLFIMCDQLRADYLSCYGSPWMHTPNIDALASRGVRFEQAYVQSGVCGPSRMSFYTGRYPSSHGATWNFIPMPASELAIGDYLAQSGRRFHLAGKTHFEPSEEAARAARRAGGRSADSLLQGGFTVLCRHEGDLPSGKEDYKAFLHRQGYDGDDPWLGHANSGRHADGSPASGWQMRHAHLAAAVQEPHSETAYVTDVAIDFIRRRHRKPWALHLSYIKPHWPYMAPAPYHAMYRDAPLAPVRRRRDTEANEHPVLRAYRSHDECLSFEREDVAAHVKPAYMGLIRQIDDHLGRLFAALEQTGQADDTLVIFTSDHGDLLGDYGFGEKELFYDVVQRVPLIIADPRPTADATRGGVEPRFAEAVDIVPTILEALQLPPQDHRVEGRSLLPLLHGQAVDDWRDCAISELDYATRRARHALGRPRDADCRGWMVRTPDWKLVEWSGYRPQLFDLLNDPDEFQDLGADTGHEAVIAELRQRLLRHTLGLKRRVGANLDRIEAMTDHLPPGIDIGKW
ncbi:MAG: sulfatase-like hydrolase/transferase [Pigmentiphaga sp.]|nr:sulfatase-like hydrolase/transferase [Pigmentiphaga sp.]